MSDTCCPAQAPKVVVEVDYNPKGTYQTYCGRKTYITGPRAATKGIFVVYDIFGFFPQTLQGADILSTQLDALVAIPDFFDGEPCDIDIFPPDTEEKRARLGVFWETKADLTTSKVNIMKSLGALKEGFPEAEKWAVIGYCWGGKMATLVSAENSPFIASVQIHPARLDPADAYRLTNAHFLYASGDEPVVAVNGFKEALGLHPNPDVREKSQVETRCDMYHGWMAARARLNDEVYFRGYQEGYEKVAQFLRKHF